MFTTTPDAPIGTTADTWQPENYRVVFGPPRSLPSREDFTVTTTAIQLRDGTIDDGEIIEPPHVYLDANSDKGLTVGQARRLAVMLMDAADEIEGWTR
jgi:hypothetical protein